MSELTAGIHAEVVAACQAGAEEAGGALSRSLDGEFTVTVGEPGSYQGDSMPEGFDGAGFIKIRRRRFRGTPARIKWPAARLGC